MTLGRLLKEEHFSYLKVLNQKADLTRKISTIESSETPDVSNYLPQNTLLITTAMLYKDSPLGLCELIKSLNELPCAGLAIKLGRFIDQLDPQVIALADQLSFPIIQIPSRMTLGEIYQDLLAYVWNDQNAELTFALNTQKKFSTLLLQGASLQAMMNNLGLVTKKRAAMVDPFGNVLVATSNSTTEQLGIVHDLFYDLALYEKRTDYRKIHLKVANIEEFVSIYSIQTVGKNLSYLFLFDDQDELNTISTLVIEQILLVLGSFLYKDLYIRCNPLKLKEDILDILVNKYKKERWAESQLFTVGQRYGVKPATSYKIILATIEPFISRTFDFTNLSYREERYILIYNWLDKKLDEEFHKNILIFPETSTSRFVILIQGNYNDIEKQLKEYHETIKTLLQVEISFSFGTSVADLQSIDSSYNTAVESYHNEDEKNKIPYIKYYRTKNAKELLKMISNEQIQSFCRDNLKELMYSEEEMMIEFRKTLKTYLDCRCSVTETANTMFLHRNTIKYRIKKCEEILGRTFDDPSYCFQLQLSLVLLEE